MSSVLSSPHQPSAQQPVTVVLGLDAGGSSTKWQLLDSQTGQLLAGGRVGPLTAAVLQLPTGQQTLTELWQAVAEASAHSPQALYAGIPGLSSGGERAQQLQQQFAVALNIRAAAVQVVSDLDLAYQAHLAPEQGILLYAGTGSMAYHLQASGEVLRAGGRGYRIGDDGGGASLGREALRWVTQLLDQGKTPTGPLAEALAALTGGLDWDTLRTFVYSSPGAGPLARLAPAITQAAQQGDGTALWLLQQAAVSLATLAQTLRQRLGQPDLMVRATGGALQSPMLQDALGHALPGVLIEQRDHAQHAAARAAELIAQTGPDGTDTGSDFIPKGWGI